MLKPRAPIVALDAYQSPLSGRIGLNLDLNENTAGCSDRVLARLRALSKNEIAKYPDRAAGERVVAAFLGVTPERLLLTNGIDDGLLLLSAAYLGPRDEMLFADPTFVMYPIYGQATGARVVRVNSGADLEFPTSEVLKGISPRTRLITIANPNNPTGSVVPQEDLLRVLAAAPDAAVLVDEAYFEFGGETLLSDLALYPNLFVARTFSKAYGLAGLRLGVLAGAPEQIECLRRFCSPFNVNAAALACLEEALADQRFVADYVAEIKVGRQRLVSWCQELGLRTWPSYTNFVLVKVGDRHREFVEAMTRQNVSIRDVSGNPGCAGCVRITVGTAGQMSTTLTAIRNAVEEIGR